MNDPFRVAVAYAAFPVQSRNPEETVSEESVAQMAGEVFDCLKGAGYDPGLIVLEKDVLEFIGRVRQFAPDVLVNLCESFDGQPSQEANVAGLLELLDIPFTGNGPAALALCQDKYRAKGLLLAHGLPTPQAQLVSSPEEEISLEFPLIVKPNFEDASLGICADSIVRDGESLRRRVRHVVERYRRPALVESYIDGREFNVAVLENTKVEALPVSEIDYSGLPADVPRVLAYAAKWFEDHPLYQKTPPVCPAHVEEEEREKLQFLAVSAFKVMGCRDYARVDFRMDAEGRVYILEVNPNPDISTDAGYFRALKAAGIGYAEFWRTMIRNAAERKKGHDPADAAA
jgi:D-alanine-D-alanine ligase